DSNSPLSFTMEGFQGRPSSAVTPFYRSPGWNSVQAINKYHIEVGGPLHDGNQGKRLFDPNDKEAFWSKKIPEVFTAEYGIWDVIPFYHIFGTDELSGKSPAIQKRTPETYLAISEADAKKIGVEGKEQKVSLLINNENRIFNIKIEKSLSDGMVGLPKGLKNTLGVQFPLVGEIKKA